MLPFPEVIPPSPLAWGILISGAQLSSFTVARLSELTRSLEHSLAFSMVTSDKPQISLEKKNSWEQSTQTHYSNFGLFISLKFAKRFNNRPLPLSDTLFSNIGSTERPISFIQFFVELQYQKDVLGMKFENQKATLQRINLSILDSPPAQVSGEKR